MKASEVLNRYANGERDFCRADLRGLSFKGQDLSGADFTKTDIRGTSFTNAMLKGANFTEAKAGVQKRWLLVQQLIAFSTSSLSGSLLAYAGLFITIYVDFGNSALTQTARVTGMLLVALLLLVLIIIIVQNGLTVRTFATVSLAFAGTFTGAFAFAFTVARAGAGAFAGAGILIVAIAGAVAVAIAIGGTLAGSGAFAAAFVFALACINAVVGAFTGKFAGTFALAFSMVVALTSLCLGAYCSWQAFKEDENLPLPASSPLLLEPLAVLLFAVPISRMPISAMPCLKVLISITQNKDKQFWSGSAGRMSKN